MIILIVCIFKFCIEYKSIDLIVFVNAKDFIFGE